MVYEGTFVHMFLLILLVLKNTEACPIKDKYLVSYYSISGPSVKTIQ